MRERIRQAEQRFGPGEAGSANGGSFHSPCQREPTPCCSSSRPSWTIHAQSSVSAMVALRARLIGSRSGSCGAAAQNVQHRAKQTLRRARPANGRAEFHQRGVIETRVFGGQQFLRRRPQRALAGRGVDGDAQMDDPREHARDVRVHDGRGQVERERRHRARRVPAHAGQRGDLFQFARKLAAVFVADDLRGAVQIPRAGVVAESFPRAQHVRPAARPPARAPWENAPASAGNNRAPSPPASAGA